ncbi:hypothetical protein CN187_17965 [Sinorhizobium meliloti]|uniref:hypothetical protein n=1 Tax=Rhizobium meliloti TaxID=382 RepID=UPI000FDC06EB|nr:hypothetical protein [Sinorhizobium meliloti]RVI66073.1 hypothetical protein CN187_17965 [Sinorhizobium meliloti]
MLADDNNPHIQSGAFSSDLHRPKAWLDKLTGFIGEQLPHWRDRFGRLQAEAETVLSSQLCAHLNSVARKTPGWDILQFRIEEPDDVRQARRIDLIAAPAGEVIWIEGRRYEDFDPLLPIECKRLPTPEGRTRDKREYLRVAGGSTGGVQRFKAGLHGASHEQAVMIGYVQKQSIRAWVGRLDWWIKVFARARILGWSNGDRMSLVHHDVVSRVAILRSEHQRDLGLRNIRLQHLWIEV